MTVVGAIAYAASYMSPVGPVIGAVGLGVVIYSCVYAKRTAVITWPTLDAIAWAPGILAAAYQRAVLNHAECGLTYSIGPGSLTTNLNAGTYTLTATAIETPDYRPATESATFVIHKVKPPPNWTAEPIELTYPAQLPASELNATFSGAPGTVEYSLQAGHVATPGHYTVVATYLPSSPNYETSKAERKLIVKKGTVNLTWAKNLEIVFDATSIFNATASVEGGKLTYKFKTHDLEGSTSRLVVKGSPHTVTVEHKLAHYETVTTTCQVTVSKANMKIDWDEPQAIEYGVALTVTQLNANTFVICKSPKYTDTSTGRGIQQGSVLEGGPHVLEVTFETQDANYNTPGKKSVTLQVTPATPQIRWTPAAEISDGRLINPLYDVATAHNPHANRVAPGNFNNHIPARATLAVLVPGAPLALTMDFTPINPLNYDAVAGVTRNVNVVRIAAAEKVAAGIVAAMETKILTGEIVGATLIGAHSPSILVDPTFVTAPIGAARADGTRMYRVEKTIPPPGVGRTVPKLSTLPPIAWTDADIMRATVDTVATPHIQTRAHDGARLHQTIVNGVSWSVVSSMAGNVTMSCPTGAVFTL